MSLENVMETLKFLKSKKQSAKLALVDAKRTK